MDNLREHFKICIRIVIWKYPHNDCVLLTLPLSLPPSLTAESGLQLMYAAKEAGGNPKSVPAHEKVDEAARFMQQAVTDLTLTLEKAGGEAGLITGIPLLYK